MRIVHTMVRVKDLDVAKKFYTEALGMQVVRERQFDWGRFTLCYLGHGNDETLELMHKWDPTEYELGSAYGHIAMVTDDLRGTCEKVRSLGYKVTREPGPMRGDESTVIAYVEDPMGYQIELIEQR